MKKTKPHMSLRAIFLLLLVILLPIGTATAAPGFCLAYAYTESGNHSFLIQDNSSNFGDNITIITNCDNLTIELDGEFFARTSKNTTITIEQGLHNISLISNNFSASYSNVLFYPDFLKWESNYRIEMNQDIELINIDLVDSRTNWAVFFGVVVVWILCVYVYWNLINSFIQRNFIEEVTQ
jgi:hypothetical protein